MTAKIYDPGKNYQDYSIDKKKNLSYHKRMFKTDVRIMK